MLGQGGLGGVLNGQRVSFAFHSPPADSCSPRLPPPPAAAECTQLLAYSDEQECQVAEYLQQLEAEARQAQAQGGGERAAGAVAMQRAQLQAALQQRRAATALVQECLAIAEAVARRMV